jgi:hypothetical protein
VSADLHEDEIPWGGGVTTPSPSVETESLGGTHSAPFVEALPDLLTRFREHPPPSMLVPDLVPSDATILLHSQPRELKSLIVQDINLAVTTDQGRAFGLLETGPAVPAWYFTEEDGWQRTAKRFSELLTGAGLSTPPPLLHTSIGKGISLDDLDWQDAIITQAVTIGYRLITFDPLRSLTAAADQGPRELKPIVSFIRRLMREAGCAVIIVHHDTKPGEKPDQRRRHLLDQRRPDPYRGARQSPPTARAHRV